MEKIKSFSEDIQGQTELYGKLEKNKSTDLFSGIVPPMIRHITQNKFILIETGEGLEPGYQRAKKELDVTKKEVDEASRAFFEGLEVTDKQIEILNAAWSKIFEKPLKTIK